MLDVARRLRTAGVLGLNERNSDFIMRLNPRRLYPRVDDKVLTKELATAAGMAVPDLYGVIANQGAVSRFPEIVAEHDSFVIKPAQGSGGDGILVITGHARGGYRKISGDVISRSALEHHLSNILSGMYSLGGQADKAIIEPIPSVPGVELSAVGARGLGRAQAAAERWGVPVVPVDAAGFYGTKNLGKFLNRPPVLGAFQATTTGNNHLGVVEQKFTFLLLNILNLRAGTHVHTRIKGLNGSASSDFLNFKGILRQAEDGFFGLNFHAAKSFPAEYFLLNDHRRK